ncbi:MAG TPA: MBL fold metallo-hydrolase [Dehalococcoidia bacterium]|nr:MBL fold metallo-hydrolase [Dehalococcoidia bacterium]
MAERIRIGNAEIAVATDAEFRYAPINFIPKGGDRWRQYLGGNDPAEIIESRVMTFVIRSQGKTILVDTGVGQHGLWRWGDGHLLDSLKELDLRPEDIDFVLPTHLHLDHVGWNTRSGPDGQPVPTFTNARYLFQQADWDKFTSPEILEGTGSPLNENTARMMKAAVVPMKDTGLMDLIGPERVLSDEVTLLHTPGHTPGSVTVLIQSGSDAALLIGDAAHHPAQLTEQDWTPGIDVDPSLSERSRKAVVDQAQRLGAVLAGAHFGAAADPAFGRIIVMDGRPMWRGVSL